MSRRLEIPAESRTNANGSVTSTPPVRTGNATIHKNRQSEKVEKDAAQNLDFESAMQEHADRIGRFCARLTNWHCDSPDLTQDVFVIAYEKWGSFRGDSATETWLMGIALRVCRNWQRKQSVKSKVLGLLGQRESDQEPPSNEFQDQCDDLRQALAKVDVKSREILVLHYLEHESIESIAASLNCSRAATDKRLSRARKRLAAQLKDYA